MPRSRNVPHWSRRSPGPQQGEIGIFPGETPSAISDGRHRADLRKAGEEGDFALNLPGGIVVSDPQATNPVPSPILTDVTPTAPGTPAATTGANENIVYFDVTWNAPTGNGADNVQSYNLQYKLSSASVWVTVRSTGRSIRVQPVEPLKSYDFRVQAVTWKGNVGPFSSVLTISAGKDAVAPAAVAGLTVTTGLRTLFLQFTANTEADLDHYRIQVDDTSSAFGHIIHDGYADANMVAVTDLQPATQYWVRVAALDKSANQGPYSSTVTATTPRAVTGDITDGAITTVKIGDSQVTTIKVADTAVTSTKLADGAVTTAKIGDAQVSTNKVADGAVTTIKIGDSQITTIKIADGSLTGIKFATGVRPVIKVTSLPTLPDATNYPAGSVVYLTTDGKLYRTDGSTWSNAVATADLSGTITTTQITNGAITTPKLATGAVTANEIAANTITAGQIAADTITAGQIAASAIGTSELAAGAVIAAKIAADTITANEIAAGAISSSELAAGSVVAGKIGANAVTATEIAAGSVTTSKLVADAVTANELAAISLAVGKYIRSTSYSAGVSGWSIDANGNVEFNNGTFRGTLNAGIIKGSSSVSTTHNPGGETASTGGEFLPNPGAENTANVCTNPDFETNTTGWNGGNSATIARVTTQFHSGVAALQVTNPTGGVLANAEARSNTGLSSFPVIGNKAYTISAWVKAGANPLTCFIIANWWNGGSFISAVTVASAGSVTSGWTQITGTLTAPATATGVDLELKSTNLPAADVHYWDDVAITDLTPGWSPVACTLTRVTTPVHGGSNAFQITANAIGTSGMQTPTGTAGFAVQPFTTYAVGLWGRAAVTPRFNHIQVFWYKSNGSACSIASTTYDGVAQDSTSTYVQMSQRYMVSPIDAAFASVYVGIVGVAASEVHYLDDITLTEQARGWGHWVTEFPGNTKTGTLSRVASNPSTGSGSVQIGQTNTDSVANETYTGLNLVDGPFTGDAGYQFSIALKAASGQPNAYPYVVWLDSSFARVGHERGPIAVPAFASGYQTYTYTCICPSVGASYALFGVALPVGSTQYGNSISIYMDDVTCTKVTALQNGIVNADYVVSKSDVLDRTGFLMPVGGIIQFGGPQTDDPSGAGGVSAQGGTGGGGDPIAIAGVPAGWVPCDGRAISRTNFWRLFGVVGTRHGAGNGTTTFNVPNIAPSGLMTYIIKC